MSIHSIGGINIILCSYNFHLEPLQTIMTKNICHWSLLRLEKSEPDDSGFLAETRFTLKS